MACRRDSDAFLLLPPILITMVLCLAQGTAFAHLCVDLNPLLYRHRFKDTKEALKGMIRALDSLLRTCVPTSSVFVAMDGPGPMAKMMTQRRRRFVKVSLDSLLLEYYVFAQAYVCMCVCVCVFVNKQAST